MSQAIYGWTIQSKDGNSVFGFVANNRIHGWSFIKIDDGLRQTLLLEDCHGAPPL
ncbi:MAG: hypothetical protein ACI9SK_002498 [Zhongshania sp.]